MKKIKVFRSRISILVVVILFVVFLPVFIFMFQDKEYLGMIALGGILLFIILSFFRTRYIISGGELLIKIYFIPCGKVNIAEIISIERSYNPISSAAASLKRLQLKFRNGSFLLISPIYENIFLEQLKNINPNIFINVLEKKEKWRVQDWDI